MIERLPHWHLANKCPAFLETESLTAIEMVSRLYGKTNELVDDYNKFVDSVNSHIEAFEESAEKNYEAFTIGIRQEFQDFIDVVELKLQAQDKDIADAVAYMKNNIQATTKTLVEKAISDGVYTVGIVYDEANYSLNFSVK